MDILRLLQPYQPLVQLEKQLQHPSEYRQPTRFAYRLLGSMAILIGGLWAALVIIPNLSNLVPDILEGVSNPIQLAAIVSFISVSGVALCFPIVWLLGRTAHNRSLSGVLRNSERNLKLMVYVAGSGASGFKRSLAKLPGPHPEQLVVFAHPPKSDTKHGGVHVSSAIVADAPVNDAMGSLESALAGRPEENLGYTEAYRGFLKAVGGDRVRVEWNLIHLGDGHTSETCQIAWRDQRTVTVSGADPARFNVVIRDAGELPRQGGPGDPADYMDETLGGPVLSKRESMPPVPV